MKDEAGKTPVYQIRVNSILDQRWVDWFNNMQITTELDRDGKPVSVFTGPVIDQVDLRGLMNKIWDLNMELISVNRIEDNTGDTGGSKDETIR
jgi:hypothetical protein